MPRQERLQSATGIYHVMLGMKNDGTFGAIDNLTISYDGNRLVKVTDAAEALNYSDALDFNDGADVECEYDYDSNGALTRDSNRGINSITYDYGHHTYKIDLDLNNRPRNILNDYTSDGRKLLSKHVMSIPKVNGYTKKTTTDMYIDGLMLRGDTTLLWRFDGGYVELNANGTPTRWNYYVTDHLGSTRMVVDSNDSIRETINYYPFGSEMRMEAPAQMTNNLGHPFRFTGKELDRKNGLNMYDFGARMFDVAGVPMWTSVDPLAEKYYNISPYAYCHNNPINRIDVEGLYDTLNVQSNKNYEVLVVLPTKRDKATQKDYKAAKMASMPIVSVDDISDFADALSDLKDQGTTFNSVTINSHGNASEFGIGADNVNVNTDVSSLEAGLKGKQVYINACNVGNGEGLITNFSIMTESTVIAPMHRVAAGYKYNGQRKLLNYTQGNKNNNKFKVVNANGIKIVKNLTIDKNKGIKWEK